MIKRPASHNRVQKLGRIRDFFTCQVCGSKERTEGHHILDFRFGGAADVDNIVTLCHDCHQGIHKGLFDIIKF